MPLAVGDQERVMVETRTFRPGRTVMRFGPGIVVVLRILLSGCKVPAEP